MNNEVVTMQNRVVKYTLEQINVIKNTIAKDATDTELALFLNQCERTGLDAMTRQIYFMKDKSGKVLVQTSVDGFRLIAERSGSYEGQTKAEWCGVDGKWLDIWTSKDLPFAARIGVYKKGFREALYAVAIFDEYAQKFGGKLGFMWEKMPSLMISKVAECLALRKAFPNDLSGLYAKEEMEQAENKTQKEVKWADTKPQPQIQASGNTTTLAVPQNNIHFTADQPPEGFPLPITNHTNISEVLSSGDYIIQIGKEHKGKRLSDVNSDELDSFLGWLKKQDDGKPRSGKVLEFMENAEKYLQESGYYKQ